MPPPALSRPAAGEWEVCCLNPLESPEWDKLVAAHPGATIFHTAAWARVLSRTYGHRPFYFVCRQGGRLAALLPVMEVHSSLTGRRGVSLPFSDSCAPLFFEGNNPSPVLKMLDSLAAERGWKHWEIRGSGKADLSATPWAMFFGHTLDLTRGADQIFNGFAPAVRRAIRKAERSELMVTTRYGGDAIVAYYQLHVRTRRRHGLPPQPFAFFRNIQEEVIGSGLGRVVLASQNGQLVAGAVFLHSGRGALYKFGACDERRQNLRANNLVMWTGIRSLSEEGYETLDFGRSSSHQAGLRSYKLGWGTVEAPLKYFRSDSRSGAWLTGPDNAAGFHNVIFSHLPLRLNRLIGGLIYPHLD